MTPVCSKGIGKAIGICVAVVYVVVSDVMSLRSGTYIVHSVWQRMVDALCMCVYVCVCMTLRSDSNDVFRSMRY